ncbi:GntR family transcriptional regulator [Kocuria soli]|uniref:GntR family transcriptional regulator n=1 Tax=Kocuria soli TaxID=2485125 RepID=A0A3N3ZS32_9MICC|nr:GntR family transcriptional regulator [Kocuria soli]ROZ64263.1 GntR family transcriptional regulator [Kocuria soli]
MQETNQSSAVKMTDVSLLDRVRDLVLGGEYEPGDLVPEQTLAEQFGVSRTPVREVLKQLQNEGLVEIRPRVGTFVRHPSQREIVELFQLKEALEGLAAGLLAQRGAVPELQSLEENLVASDRAALDGDSQRYAELVHEFHWTIVRGSDNQKLLEHYQRLMNQLAYHRIVTRTVADPARLINSNSEHHKVVDAIRNKNAVNAEFSMRQHVNASSQAALVSRGDEGSSDDVTG